ncbi:MAG TPA: glycosyltransferase family 4 protein, partial [Polyangiaceae bacterium]|nr:glycosyltransferase family 4 protein [Polyangiaceae bacterium]
SITEGLPLALLEAMATELPVVCTAVGGVPDVLDDGVTGLLVPVDDPDSLTARLASLAHNSALARRIGAAGRRLVLERHSLDRMARAYEDLYEGARDRWPACC